METMFYDGWFVLVRTAVIGVSAYVGLVFLLRIAGKRILSKMNAFDLVVTVALGSTLATILLNRNVALAEGLLAFAVLIGLQFAVTWSSVRVPGIRHLVTGEPTLLLFRGTYLVEALKRERVTREEVQAAIREAGIAPTDEVDAVVLETDGSFSVIGRMGDASATLGSVEIPDEIGDGRNAS